MNVVNERRSPSSTFNVRETNTMDDDLEHLNQIDGLYDNDDDDDIVVVASVLHLLAERKKKKRRSKWFRRRLDWDAHVGMTHNERRDGFHRRYHMSEASFKKLVELLRPHLSIDAEQSR